MGKREKWLLKFLSGASDANIDFDELRDYLKSLNFEERIRGSHHVFRKQGIEEKINLQRESAKAKPYQVRQVRSILVRYRLIGRGRDV